MSRSRSLSRAAKKIKHPGVEIEKAKRNGISTHKQLERDSHRSDPKTRARGNLGLVLSASAKRRKK